MIRRFRKLFLYLNLLVAVCLILACAGYYISPVTAWIFSLAGLALPFLIPANLAFVFFWLLLKRKEHWISAILIISSFPVWKNYFGFHFNSRETEGGIKIVSYNVRLFDFYNWREFGILKPQMFDLLEKMDADVYCFQEFIQEDLGRFPTHDTLIHLLKTPYHHVYTTQTFLNVNHLGTAIYSRYPIVNKGVIHFEGNHNNCAIYVDIVKEGKKVRVYNTHLQSIKLQNEDYTYFDNFLEWQDSIPVDASLKIMERLKKGFQNRAPQAEKLKEQINKSPFPVILCGDFNDSPASYTYKTLSEGLEDAYLKNSFGIGSTYINRLPIYRIDYILCDPKLKSSDFQVYKKEYSDHYPISCKVEL